MWFSIGHATQRTPTPAARTIVTLGGSCLMLCRTPNFGHLAAMLAAFTLASAHAAETPVASGDNVAAVRNRIAEEYSSLETLYKYLHVHPELSYQEQQSAARMAKELKQLGFAVTEKVGGHGVVGIFKNGDGPTVLIRTDMDALPVTEQTGLPYASKLRTRDKDGNDVGIMHACGHDMHMTCWVGTARVLTSLKDHWKGTLVFIGQPAEEVGAGARMMLDDGLFKNFQRPDYALALHCDSFRPHGTITFTEGLAMANVDSVDILVKGKGGHGSAPHTTIDPVVLAARIVLDLQTLVSRETNPTDPAVVTVGSIHGGSKHNIIPNEVKLQITVRSTKDAVRKHLLDGIKRIADAAAVGAGAPEPVVTVHPEEFTPALLNEPKLTRRIVALFREVLGEDKVGERPPVMGGEDFSRYGRAGVPIFMYFLGTQPPEKVAAAEKGERPLPSLHSDSFYPVPEPTIKTGVLTMSLAALSLLGK
jgi:amidohydrolase